MLRHTVYLYVKFEQILFLFIIIVSSSYCVIKLIERSVSIDDTGGILAFVNPLKNAILACEENPNQV